MLIISNSRIRRFFLDDLVIFLDPLGCTKHGETLIIQVGFKYGPSGVMVYDPNDDEPTESVYGPNCYFVDAVTYEQSLVTPKGYEDEELIQRDEPITYTEFELYEYSQNRNFRTVDY